MSFAQLTRYLMYLVNTTIVPIIFGITFVVFLWGMVNYYFLDTGDAQKRTNAHSFMLWGIIGMVLLFSIWGIIHLALRVLYIGY